ncbi:MAG: hypothetical protein HC836_31745 [Richelia sp. RM2_1_2]|nr:hypothetical protein [Richelia sp. RM2_1_2]
MGITEFNGFAPKVISEKGSDVYMAVELATKIAKHSTIPKISDVIKKIADAKPLNEVDLLIKVAIDDYTSQINSALYTSLKDESLKNDILKNWLSSVKMAVRKRRRELLQQIAEIKFSLILSKKWFEEFASFDENTLDVTVDKKKLSIKFEMAEKEVNV